MQLLERLARALNIESIALDVGFDMTIETLISRAEQLSKAEFDFNQDRKTLIYNLQRKVKSLKEQLESRDLHIDLLRKKVGNTIELLWAERSYICSLLWVHGCLTYKDSA